MTTERRYDVDWLRVIAIGLLLIYHTAIGFQLWGTMVGFIVNEESWEALWFPMAMLNVWRIPLLFFVSGMGVYFAIKKRSWTQLLLERARRILLPFLFGMFLIVPVHIFIWQNYYDIEPRYNSNPGHLWFLGNIFAYVALLAPLFIYLQRNAQSVLAKLVRRAFGHPIGWFVVIAAFVSEAQLVDPKPYELYGMTWHGFFLGALAFFFGFCFVYGGEKFWKMAKAWRWVFLGAAVALFLVRFFFYQYASPGYLLAIESNCWVFSVFGWGYAYLNRPSKALSYLSQAAYPVYILHMIFLYAGSAAIFPLNIAVPLKFIILAIVTGAGCFGAYELIRRINILRPLFGLKMKKGRTEALSVSQ